MRAFVPSSDPQRLVELADVTELRSIYQVHRLRF